MKYDPAKHHRRSIRLQGYDYSQAGAYFITICTWQRECLFGEIIDGEMQLSRWGEIVYLHWQNLPKHHQNLELDEFVIMPNHLHGIIVLINNNNNSVGAGLADIPEQKQTTSQQNPPSPTHQTPNNPVGAGLADIPGQKQTTSQQNPPFPTQQPPNNPVGAGLADIPGQKQITSQQNPPFPTQQPPNNPVGAGLADISRQKQTTSQQNPPSPTQQPPNNPVGAGLADIPGQKQTTSQQNPPSPMVQPQTKPKNVPEIIRGFKTFSARRINQIRGRSGVPVWQRNYYEHIIRNEESLQHIREYIINNPLTWQLDKLHPNNPSKW